MRHHRPHSDKLMANCCRELVFEKGFEALRQDKWRRYLRYTSGQDAHQLPLRLGRRSRGFESLADWQALYTQLVRFCRHLPHSLLALALLCVQAVALLGILWLMLSHHRGSEGLQSVLHERIATLPLALNVSTVESGDFERLYAALLQNRVWLTTAAVPARLLQQKACAPDNAAFLLHTSHTVFKVISQCQAAFKQSIACSMHNTLSKSFIVVCPSMVVMQLLQCASACGLHLKLQLNFPLLLSGGIIKPCCALM